MTRPERKGLAVAFPDGFGSKLVQRGGLGQLRDYVAYNWSEGGLFVAQRKKRDHLAG